ncbi:hypothetical protein CCPUN_05450 [Cardinium endosymbiont of Culicoides punctatus]|nr:hypothetical protein CCPUN_05450 [Cardinium endosymbiont of Culicoides punctatus]
MAFVTKLFRIMISNRYYQVHNSENDFDIIPLPSTSSWMTQHQIRMLHYADGIELVWLSQNYDHPLELFKKKANGVTLSFVMTLKNTQTLNLSELEAGHPTGQVYYLHNRHDHNDNLLHGNAFISPLDLVKIKEVAHYPTQPGWNVFAIIDMDLSYWMRQLSKQKDIGVHNYKIKIQNRSTFWRYYLVDTRNQLNGKCKILPKGDSNIFCFGAVKSSTELPNTYYATSTAPIAFCDKYDYFFSLATFDKSDTGKNEKILLEKLPYPTYDSIKRDKGDKKKLYSDIVVYV